MNPSQLWNDHTLRVLLKDLFKARNDDQLGPMRLEALKRYMDLTEPRYINGARNPAAPVPRETMPPERRLVARPPDFEFEPAEPELDLGSIPKAEVGSGFDLEEMEPVQERSTFCYKCNTGRIVAKRGKIWRCKTCNSSNVNSEPSPHDANLGAYAESEAVHRSNPLDALNKTADLIEEKVKQGQLVFTIPKTYFVQGIKDHLKARRFAFSDISCTLQPNLVHIDPTSAGAISGDLGSKTGGWTITVTR